MTTKVARRLGITRSCYRTRRRRVNKRVNEWPTGPAAESILRESHGVNVSSNKQDNQLASRLVTAIASLSGVLISAVDDIDVSDLERGRDAIREAARLLRSNTVSSVDVQRLDSLREEIELLYVVPRTSD